MVRQFRGRRVLMTLFVIPLFISPVIVGTFFSLILTQPFGPTNYLLGQLLGHPVTIDFTNDSPWVYISIILADAWQWTPFMFVILLAGLTSISDELYQAADLDGAKPRQAFFFVTLPLLLPIVLLAITFRLVDSMKLFDLIYVLTRGGPGTDTYTASYYLYQQGFQLFHLGPGHRRQLDAHVRDSRHRLLARPAAPEAGGGLSRGRGLPQPRRRPGHRASYKGGVSGSGPFSAVLLIGLYTLFLLARSTGSW